MAHSTAGAIARLSSALLIGAAAVGSAPLAIAGDNDSDIYQGAVESRLDSLAHLQPGLGTVMREYGDRFVDVYFAASGGNWGLAQYQLKEMREAQEVGEATRPAKAPMLKMFEKSFLDPLDKTIRSKDLAGFKARYAETLKGCNGCHAATGHHFIHVHLPAQPVDAYLDFSVKSDPKGGDE